MASPAFFDDASALGAQSAVRKRDNALRMDARADTALKIVKERP